MPGYVRATTYFTSDNITAIFMAKFSIPKKTSRDEKDGALLLLNFLMADYAQNIMSIQYNYGYPLNKALSEEFIQSHKDLIEYSNYIIDMNIVN